jgi:hypothetical protein
MGRKIEGDYPKCDGIPSGVILDMRTLVLGPTSISYYDPLIITRGLHQRETKEHTAQQLNFQHAVHVSNGNRWNGSGSN